MTSIRTRLVSSALILATLTWLVLETAPRIRY